jgi:hypothetical protein
MWLTWWLRGRVSAEACGPGAQEKQSRTGLAERAQCAGLAEYASEKNAGRGAVACPTLETTPASHPFPQQDPVTMLPVSATPTIGQALFGRTDKCCGKLPECRHIPDLILCSQGAASIADRAKRVDTSDRDARFLDDRGNRESMDTGGKRGNHPETSVIRAVHGSGSDPDIRDRSSTTGHSGRTDLRIRFSYPV